MWEKEKKNNNNNKNKTQFLTVFKSSALPKTMDRGIKSLCKLALIATLDHLD